MAQTEEIVILNVQTGEAIQNMADLRSNVKALKGELDNLEIGSEEYQNTLNELKLNQNALKDAMYATSGTMDDVIKGAAGMSESYNSLVHRMAALKEEFRSTTDVMRRAELGQQIKAVNDELKSLDALQGNFQRNVGNYAESIKQAFSEMPEYAEPLKKSFENVDKSMSLLSKNPLMGIITLLFPLIQKITEELKGNSTAIEAVDKAMQALKPVTDFFAKAIDMLAKLLADVISKVTEFVAGNGLLQKVISGVVGVGNAIIQNIIAPFKGIVAAIKVFKEQGIKGIKDAAEAFGNEMSNGISFRKNFKAGQAVADAMIQGTKSKKKEMADSFATTIEEVVEEGFKKADFDKALAEAERKFDADLKARLDAQRETNALIVEDYKQTYDEIGEWLDKELEAERKAEEEKRKEAEITAEAKKATLFELAGATSAILNSLADIYESDAEKNEQAAKRAKNIRIASATIDTISGAIAAYMQAVGSMPPPFGAIVGAAQAAAVTAAGMANIAKIRSTNISANDSGVSSIGATVSAPSLGTGVPQTSIISSASQEDRLNRMADEQRVYILQSDIEASDRSHRVRVAEASF